jgi:beta-glucosidase
VNGIPVGVNKYILRDLLREEMGFEGILISDYAAIEECITHEYRQTLCRWNE